MAKSQTLKSRDASAVKPTVGRLFFLEASQGRILSANPDGSGRKNLVDGCRSVVLEQNRVRRGGLFPRRNGRS